ncbi:hypothetical protein CRUP_002813 [Coryphaenoides rupestris]|nr:hypothetical protein CRUP_002813 [Coryphaenoides rupestris]
MGICTNQDLSNLLLVFQAPPAPRRQTTGWCVSGGTERETAWGLEGRWAGPRDPCHTWTLMNSQCSERRPRNQPTPALRRGPDRRGPGVPGRSASMRSPTKTREALTKVLPLRWEPIASLVVTPPLAATPPPVSRAAQALGSDGGQRDPGGGIPRPQLRGGILGGHVTHSAPPSRESTLRRARAQTGPPLSPPPQRNQLHGTLNREEGGRSQESLLSLLRPAFLRRPAPSVTAVESLGHANGHPAKMSLSNGTLNGEGPGGRSRAPRRHDQVTATTDITRAHSSGSIPGRTDHHHHPQHHHHHLLRRMVEQPCCDPLQRAQYSTTSLGRQGAGLGVRF